MNIKKRFNNIFIPCFTVFFSSFCIMVIELVASRLIARHLGSSLYTWTGVIGVVLAGITIGNWLGGRLADKFSPAKTLGTLFIIASIACVITIIMNNLVGNWIFLWKLSWPVRTFSHISLVFLLPSVVLGTISPVVAKMALDKGLATGRTIGNIYAWGAAGSIAGTFAAGYYLIAAMGTISIIWTVSGALLFLGILYWAKNIFSYLWLIVFVVAVFFCNSNAKIAVAIGLKNEKDTNKIYEAETPYCYVAVEQKSKSPDIRAFIQDKLKHSEIDFDDINDLKYFYTKIYAGITHGLGDGKKHLKAMIIGGGGYVFPQYLKQNWPKGTIEVVEIDPGVTKAAEEAFGLSRYKNIKTITADARNYIDDLLRKQSQGEKFQKYDFIFEDAINDYSVPFQLVTEEFNKKIEQVLADDGIYMVNLIDTVDNGKFLGSVIKTQQQVFPFVYVATSYVSLPSLRDTFVVISSKHKLDIKKIFHNYNPNLRLWHLDEKELAELKNKANNTIITDDYAPVENMLAPVVKQSAKEVLARKILREASKFKKQGNLQKSILKYKEAANLNPSMTIKAYNEIGLMEVSLGNLNNAVSAFKYAVGYHLNNKRTQNVVGSIYLNLGTLHQRMGDNTAAKKYFINAIDQFKIELKEESTSLLWSKIGNTYASMGDFPSASNAFEKALKLEPNNIIYYNDLTKSLEFEGKIDDAILILQQGIKHFRQNDDTKAGLILQQNLNYLIHKYKKK